MSPRARRRPTRRRAALRRGPPAWAAYDFPPPAPPIPVEDGLKARSRRGAIGETWWSQRFIAVLERFHEGPRLARGRAYARKGQVISLELEPGSVTALVQGSRPRPYHVEVRASQFDDAEWARAEAAIAGRALFLARLLAGEMPPEIEEAFADCHLSLFPASSDDLAADCSCPDWGNPCKHIAAVYYLLAERFDEDPFLILAWRGRPRRQLLAELRVLRGDTSDTAAEGAAGPENASASGMPGWAAPIPGADAPVEVDPARFWGEAGLVASLDHVPIPTAMPEAILRELPASGIAGADGRPIEASLAPLYERIVRAASEQLVPGTGLAAASPRRASSPRARPGWDR